jgi:hypothetical protein
VNTQLDTCSSPSFSRQPTWLCTLFRSRLVGESTVLLRVSKIVLHSGLEMEGNSENESMWRRYLWILAMYWYPVEHETAFKVALSVDSLRDVHT